MPPALRWDDYRPIDYRHATSVRWRRRVDAAKVIIQQWLTRCQRPYVAVSGGKDSVCMSHLIAEVATATGHAIPPTMWHNSGVEWPETETVIRRLQENGTIKTLIIVTPEQDVLQLKREQVAGRLSRAQKDQQALFRPIAATVQAHGFDGVALGLRAEESRGRLMNRCTRGSLYGTRQGLWHCTPLAEWSWLDVFAYLATHRLPLHPIYSAPLYHLEHRGRIRLSWWASTDHHRHGQLQWMRLVFPEIYQRLRQAIPQITMLD